MCVSVCGEGGAHFELDIAFMHGKGLNHYNSLDRVMRYTNTMLWITELWECNHRSSIISNGLRVKLL